MQLTNDQYCATGELRKWFNSRHRQIFELAGTIGTGIMETVDNFLQLEELEPYEICYLTYDQETVMQYALNRLHCYYLPSIIYKYYRWTNLDTFDILNPFKKAETRWIRDPRDTLKGKYRIIIVLDSLMLDRDAIERLVSFGRPILLLRDPCLTPSRDSYCYGKDPTFRLDELNETLMKDPLVYFPTQVLLGKKIRVGSYDSVNVVTPKTLNISNLRNTDMIITMSEDLSDEINTLCRTRLRHYGPTLKVGDKVICMSDMYGYKMQNPEEPRLMCYLRSGIVGKITKCNYHSPNTRYVTADFSVPWWPDPFRQLSVDRSLMVPADVKFRNQVEPDDPVLFRYAYALPVGLARVGSWDRLTVLADNLNLESNQNKALLYTAMTRCSKKLTLCI